LKASVAPGFYWLICAQFVSALADNALLLITMAVLMAQGYPAFWIPLLKWMFTLSYVVLGPWVGAWADTWPKQRVMMWANAIKTLACAMLIMGLNPLLSFALAGLGAAIYAPAKYGLITEMEPPERLVAANGWIEVSTVCAALFGVMLGGLLVSDHWLLSVAHLWIQQAMPLTTPYAGSLGILLMLYVASAALNTRIPDSGVRYAPSSWHVKAVWLRFQSDHLTLWRDPMGSISLSVTTLFWGVGATLQLLVLAWAQDALGLSLTQAAYLQGATALGVIAGAALAAKIIALSKAPQVIGMGILLGLMLPLMSVVTDGRTAIFLVFAMGAVGGFFVVPMNAMLQHRGVQLLSAGRSISVQNVNENANILLMMGVYSALLYADLNVETLTWLLGGLVTLGMAWIRWRYQRMNNQPSN
jgi:MFS family permease